eukprot:Lankesteria_metandrocarpae@DN2384_c0_g1_i2.p1
MEMLHEVMMPPGSNSRGSSSCGTANICTVGILNIYFCETSLAGAYEHKLKLLSVASSTRSSVNTNPYGCLDSATAVVDGGVSHKNEKVDKSSNTVVEVSGLSCAFLDAKGQLVVTFVVPPGDCESCESVGVGCLQCRTVLRISQNDENSQLETVSQVDNNSDELVLWPVLCLTVTKVLKKELFISECLHGAMSSHLSTPQYEFGISGIELPDRYICSSNVTHVHVWSLPRPLKSYCGGRTPLLVLEAPSVNTVLRDLFKVSSSRTSAVQVGDGCCSSVTRCGGDSSRGPANSDCKAHAEVKKSNMSVEGEGDKHMSIKILFDSSICERYSLTTLDDVLTVLNEFIYKAGFNKDVMDSTAAVPTT